MPFEKYRYDGSRSFQISKSQTDETSLCDDRRDAEAKLEKNNALIDELQAKLYAEKKEGVIFLFQAMDAAGKDGTIRAVLSCLSPHGVHEAAFKAPSSDELAHDFLWRIAAKVPAKGEIAIFNRSQYEDVLIGKVKKLYRSQANARRIDLDNRDVDVTGSEMFAEHIDQVVASVSASTRYVYGKKRISGTIAGNYPDRQKIRLEVRPCGAQLICLLK